MYIKKINNFLSENQCNEIIKKYFDNLEIAEIGNDVIGVINLKKRNSQVRFEDIPEVKDKLIELINKEIKIKGFELEQFKEKFQLTKYEIGGHYDWHTDGKNDILSHRFLSIVIQLNNNYTGGELLYKNENDEEIEFVRGIGNLFIFHSSIMHKVAPILNGERYSLVSWLNIKTIENQKTLI
jgi:PKHD-type hydroxylase